MYIHTHTYKRGGEGRVNLLYPKKKRIRRIDVIVFTR